MNLRKRMADIVNIINFECIRVNSSKFILGYNSIINKKSNNNIKNKHKYSVTCQNTLFSFIYDTNTLK